MLTLNWKPTAGGSTVDSTGLWIEPMNGGDSVFQTPEFGSAGALDGTANAVTIPASTMRAGRSYSVEIEFIHLASMDTTTLPGSSLVVAYLRTTRAQITAAGVIAGPQITLTPWPNNQWNVRVTGDSGINYVLEATSQLGTGWERLVNFQIFGNAFEFTDGTLHDQRYYQVR